MLLFSVSRRRWAAFKSIQQTSFNIPSCGFKSQIYHENRVLPYSAKELYAVVADVASYPTFIPFCTGSRIEPTALERAMQRQTVVDAELTIGFMSLRERYVSTVTFTPYKSVQAVAVSSTSMFKNLSTMWKFQSVNATEQGESDDPSGPTWVSYHLTYEFLNPLYGATSAAFFGQVAEMMIKAFEDRCLVIYGK